MRCGTYRIPNMKSHGRLIYTNKLRFGAFRGFGNPQVTFEGEEEIEERARRRGIAPFGIGRKNRLRHGDPWFVGPKVASNGLLECLDKVEDASGWKHRMQKQDGASKRGYGLAVTAHISGLLGTGAIVRMLEDGTISLNTGATDIGQGSDTVLAQICAETLKVPLEQVSVASPDTDGSPHNWGTTASRVTYTTGRAVAAAAADVVAQVKKHAAAMLDCDEARIEIREGGRVGIVGANTDLPYAAISARAHWAEGGPIVGTKTLVFEQPTHDPKRAVALGLPFPRIGVFSFAAQLTEVEADEATGQTRGIATWTTADAGRAINPRLVQGQLEGGSLQRMAYPL